MAYWQADSEDDDMIGVDPIEINSLICDLEYVDNRLNRNDSWLPILGFAVVFIFSILFILIFLLPAPHTHRNNENNSTLPRQTRTLTDWGCPTRFRGWIDVQQQGVPNDYARYVGPTDEHPFIWFSIALAGSTEQYTDPGLYEEHSGIVRRTSVKPRQIIEDIDKLGLPDHFRGWVDVQNQGVANDYAYYVAATDDIPFHWLTVALAGSLEQRTCVGLYMEKYGVVRPTLGKLHYEQSIAGSCQYWASMIRRFCQSLPNYVLHNLNFISNHYQPSGQQIIAGNLSNNTISNGTSMTLWRQLLSKDILMIISKTINNAASKTLCLQLFAIMIVLVAFHHIFRF